jgi:hypothetical protein
MIEIDIFDFELVNSEYDFEFYKFLSKFEKVSIVILQNHVQDLGYEPPTLYVFDFHFDFHFHDSLNMNMNILYNYKNTMLSWRLFAVSFWVFLIVNLLENVIYYNIGKHSLNDFYITIPSYLEIITIVSIMLFFAGIQAFMISLFA